MNLGNESGSLPGMSLIDALRNQIDTLLLILERPVVQRQVGVFLLVIFCAWLAPWLLRRSLQVIARRRPGHTPKTTSRWQWWKEWLARVALAVGYTFFPILGLVFGHLAVNLFTYWEWRAGLIERLLPLFWLLLGYRIVAGFLHGILDAHLARRYHTRFLAPLSLIFVVTILRSTLAGALPIGGITLVTLLDTSVTLQALFAAVVILYLFLAAAWIVDDSLNRSIAEATSTGQGAANTMLVFSRYAIIGLGILAAISTLGFNLSALTIIGGGLSVGIGFGLQELVANFVSGILLLFDRTLRPGDVIEIGGHRGVIDQLRMRATVMRTADNVEVFVPNKNLLTSTMTTYTQTDRVVRRVLTVGVSYKNQPTVVRDLLLNVAMRHGQVLKKPEPVVFFTGFASSRLDFELAIWTDDPLNAPRVTSDLYFMIWSEFEKHQIEILPGTAPAPAPVPAPAAVAATPPAEEPAAEAQEKAPAPKNSDAPPAAPAKTPLPLPA